MVSVSSKTKFIEYLYEHLPKRGPDEEMEFFKRMYHLHRASRDPTFRCPDSLAMDVLYLFPYGSELIRSSPKHWDQILPKTVKDDLVQFFQNLQQKGKKIAILECADQMYVELDLSFVQNKD